MLTYLLMLVLSAGASTARGQVSAQGASDPSVAQEASDSTTGTQSNYGSDLTARHESPSWLFPITELDKRLPSWIRIGGQYRNRLEGPIGIGFTGTNDFYLLDRLRVRAVIQPKPWLASAVKYRIHVSFSITTLPTATPMKIVGRSGKLTLRLAAPQKVGWMF